MTRAKICGITCLEDALLACESGAWALGFNFHHKSPRYISPQAARDITSSLPEHVLTVGVFVEQNCDEILAIVDRIGLHFAQVYRDMPCTAQDKKRMVLALQARSIDEVPADAVLKQYAYVLIDAPREADGLHGGTGRQPVFEVARDLAARYPLMLAGGMNPKNLRQAIDDVHPFAVDVASGVESAPGVKDLQLMKQFIEEANHGK